MAYKIHKRGAFVIIENTVNGEIKELNSQFVQITKGKTSLDQYEVLYNGVSQLKAVLGDIQDANGVAYVEADWDIFRYEQCGSVNSSEVANPYPAPTTVEVDITSAQILNAHSTEITLLPAQIGNNYDLVEKVIVEYTHNGTPYSISSSGFIKIFRTLDSGSNGPIKWIYGSMITANENNIVVPETSTVTQTIGFPQQTNNRQTLSIMQSALVLSLTHQATLGDGTIRAIITYTTRTFGA